MVTVLPKLQNTHRDQLNLVGFLVDKSVTHDVCTGINAKNNAIVAQRPVV